MGLGFADADVVELATTVLEDLTVVDATADETEDDTAEEEQVP